MLAFDIARTYPEIQLLYTEVMTPGKICYKVYQIATIEPWIADSPENLLRPFKETYPYDIHLTLLTSHPILGATRNLYQKVQSIKLSWVRVRVGYNFLESFALP